MCEPTSCPTAPEEQPSEPVRTIVLKVAYDGTNFRGWQRQPNGIRTVQGTIEDVVEMLIYPNGTPLELKPTEENRPVVEVNGSSRTDAGVHALGQIAAFRTNRNIAPKAWTGAINGWLPQDVRIVDSWQGPDDFNPIGNTKRKRYRYCIYNSRNNQGPLFLNTRAWGVRADLNLKLMNEAAQKLIGTRDCIGWSNVGSKRNDTVRTILDAVVYTTICPITGVEMTIIEVEGTGFLYNMVRIIAGTLVEIGRNKRPVDCIDRVNETGDRTLAGVTAPAHGLYLMEIWYQ